MSEEADFEVTCPICFETPNDEIYQCVNGHIICHSCSKNLKDCPQCREPYGTKKIRVRALEEVLSTRHVDCPNKLFGCDEIMRRKEVISHLKDCAFGGSKVQLCKHMGYSCDFVTDARNTQDAILHLENLHRVIKMTSSYGTIQLIDFMSTDIHTSSIWTPYICKNGTSEFLIFAKFDSAKMLSLNCIYLGNDSTLGDDLIATFSIFTDKKRLLEYTLTPVELMDVKDYCEDPPCQLSVDMLRKNYTTNSCLEFVVSIQSDEDKRSKRLTVRDDDFKWPAFCETKLEHGRQIGTNSKRPIFNIQCSNCFVVPMLGMYHSCLQCPEYDLCDDCRSSQVHLHHLFVTIKTDPEHISSIWARWNKTWRTYTALLPDCRGSISCVLCRTSGINRSASYVCQECPPLQTYCDVCAKSTLRTPCSSHKLFRIGLTI